MDTKYVNLRFHIGDILVSEVGPAYIGRKKEYAFNVDIDRLSITEINDYCRDFGVTNIEKIYIGVAQVGNLVELVKDRDLLVLANMLVAGGIMDIYICHKGEVLIKTTHTNESFETTCNEVDRPNKESTNKVGEGLNAPLGKKISLIDGRDQIVGVQQSNLIENDSRNTNEAEDEFQFSSEDENSEEDEAETIVHSDAESDENDDFSSDEDGYGSDIHEELSIVKKDLKSYLKKNKKPKRKKKDC
ncbi:hypothetical protein EJD97_014414 [Solanum chilense]|uniref:PB1-like domain-containing protein n=1 Tax=Solanum chilense TaxID=4083 RepID=A0A6N2AGL4_SOLCI|nr:hypothetical protein EJD97_014414 [Solanum chilense]